MQLIKDRIVPVAGCNEEMSNAIEQARSSINDFFDAFENPRPNRTSFFIKARFEDDGSFEHLWLSDLDFSTQPATGLVANQPDIRSVTYMERVPFLPGQISDWMYVENGKLMGGFTTKLLLRAQSRRGGFMSLLKHAFKM